MRKGNQKVCPRAQRGGGFLLEVPCAMFLPMQNGPESNEGSSSVPERVVSILHALRLTREGSSCRYAKNAIKCQSSCVAYGVPE